MESGNTPDKNIEVKELLTDITTLITNGNTALYTLELGTEIAFAVADTPILTIVLVIILESILEIMPELMLDNRLGIAGELLNPTGATLIPALDPSGNKLKTTGLVADDMVDTTTLDTANMAKLAVLASKARLDQFGIKRTNCIDMNEDRNDDEKGADDTPIPISLIEMGIENTKPLPIPFAPNIVGKAKTLKPIPLTPNNDTPKFTKELK